MAIDTGFTASEIELIELLKYKTKADPQFKKMLELEINLINEELGLYS